MAAQGQQGVLSSEPPLVVDLDGTLIRTDMLVEGALVLLRRRPLAVFGMVGWLAAGGKARLKAEVARRAPIDPATLPYNEALLAFLRERKAAGQRLILATASDMEVAKPIADHLGLFDETMASDGAINLKGPSKCARLVECFGEKGFDYAGNDRSDLEIWPSARSAILVNPAPGVVGQVARIGAHIEDRPNSLQSHLKALRPQQWLKNLLVFVPLVTSHALLDLNQLLLGVLAFIAFGLCASSVYVLNDLLDLADDRRHPRKRRRPFAAGDVPAVNGLLMAPVLLAAAIALAFAVSPYFVAALAVYFVSTTAYSFALKRIVLVDVFTLAGLYTIRLIGGSAAIELWPSFWLLAFSMFVFLSLAMLKRYTELHGLREVGAAAAPGRGYRTSDLDLLTSLGAASGYLSVLVLALYVNSQAVLPLYRRPEALWLLCPLMLYWISRAWLVAYRGNMHDDPVVFAVKDRVSRVVVVAMAAVIVAAF